MATASGSTRWCRCSAPSSTVIGQPSRRARAVSSRVGVTEGEVGLRVRRPAVRGTEAAAEVRQRHPVLVGTDAGQHVRVGHDGRDVVVVPPAGPRRQQPVVVGETGEVVEQPLGGQGGLAVLRRQRRVDVDDRGASRGRHGVPAGVAVRHDQVGTVAGHGVAVGREHAVRAVRGLPARQRRRRPTRDARGRARAGRRREPAAAGSGGRRCGAPAHHAQRLPRRSCSRSIDSKRALKLPLPKPSEPCRSMISKKTVGRSPSGLVKICSR